MDKSALTARVDALRPAFHDQLKTLVEIPSVSAQKKHKDDIRRCAAAAADLVRAAGGTAEVVETPGNPVVVGRLGNDESHPTVVVYNHIDVQPPRRGRTAGRARRSASRRRTAATTAAGRPTTRARR